MRQRRKMETSCKTYFMSGKIKELKKKKKKKNKVRHGSLTLVMEARFGKVLISHRLYVVY